MRHRTFAFLALAALGVGAALAQDGGAKSLDVGAAAPDFRLNDQDGKAARLADLRAGGWVVLAFFPKAMTPG